jgi:hypothetical protein
MEESSLEKLRKRLYKPGEEFKGRFEGPELRYRAEKIASSWSAEPEAPKNRRPFFPFSSFRFGFVLFFILIAALIGAFIFFFFRSPSFSAEKLVLALDFPAQSKVGDVVKFELTVRNENDVSLETADILFNYPKNSIPLKEEAKKRLYERRRLGGLAPREEVKEIFEAQVFGFSGERHEAKASLEFTISGSSAILEKEISGAFLIGESPLALNIEAPKEIHSGQLIAIAINYLSNSEELFEDLTLKVDYPSGFKFKDSVPKPLRNENEWKIGDFSPKQKGKIVLSGTLEGLNLEEKNFKAAIGRDEEGGFNAYAEANFIIIAKKSFLEITLADTTAEGIVSAGEIVRGELRFKNNLPSGISNLNIELSILGKAVDERTISASRGSYRGIDKKIVWTPSSFDKLKFLAPGEEGKIDFQFKVLEKLPVLSSKDKNFLIRLNAKISAAKPPPEYKDIDFSSEYSAELKVASPFGFSRKGFYYHSDLKNSGPMPPRVGRKTTYTIVFSLASPSDDISNLEIRAPLFPYVEWENKFLPQEADIKFDPSSSELILKIPKLEAGSGVLKPAREVSFQIGVTPSPPHIGASPLILGEARAVGFNEFTGKEIQSKIPALTTELREDEQLKNEDYRVKPQ